MPPSSSCSGEGPKSRLSVPSGESMRPAQYCVTGPPMVLMAAVPAKVKRSPQERPSPNLGA